MSSLNITINQINQAAAYSVLILSILSVVPGGIGLIFNVLVFIRPTLRREPCVIYFFASTCFSLFVVLIVQPVRVLAATFNIDIANLHVVICKPHWFFVFGLRAVSSWLIVMACIDRFFHSSSNAHLRRLSSVKKAKLTVAIISVFVLVLYIPLIIFYEINMVKDRYGGITPSCKINNEIFRIFFGFWNMIVYSLCPCFLMLFFGLLTMRNIHQHRLIIRTETEHNRLVRKTNTQLLRMLSAQVLVTIIATFPLSIFHMYSSFTSNIPKDTLRIAQENLFARITGIIPYFAHSTTFYLYTLTGTVFRREFYQIMRFCYHPNRRIAVANTPMTT